MPGKGPEVIGAGKEVAPPPNIVTPQATVVVHVAYVESQRTGINIHQLHVGQYVVCVLHNILISLRIII